MSIDIPAAPAAVAAAEPTPARVLFTHRYGFFTDDDLFYGKDEGETESNPIRVRDLIERKAPIVTTEAEIAAWRLSATRRQQAEAAVARMNAAAAGRG